MTMSDTLRILVVDDEPGMLAGAKRALSDFTVRLPDVNGEVRFEIDVAGSGEEAMSKIDAGPPHILLLDHKLPGMSGLDVLVALAERKPDMLTIMITAYASLETAVEATKRGAYDFLAKPFTPAELKNVVRKAAGRLVFERQARRLADEKRQVRFQFTSVLAHELKAPLSAIDGYLRIIRDREAGDDQAAYDHMLDRSLVRLEGMNKLIVDLLDLTRIESGVRERKPADLDVAEVARAAVETFAPDAKRRGILINLDAQPVVMRADRQEVEMIVTNLISNAVKYNGDGGRVDVSVRRDEGDVLVAVRDTGIGMTPQEVARLFGDFVRIKNEKTRGIAGSGLGLSIVRKLAQLYGGDASVESRAGEGSTFTVRLPLDAGAGRNANGNKQQDGQTRDN
jgi:two-component system, sensor histidine kinase and response regulator